MRPASPKDGDLPEFTETEIVWDEVCVRCGTTAPNGTVHCPACGRRFIPWIAGPAFWPVFIGLVAAFIAAITWTVS